MADELWGPRRWYNGREASGVQPGSCHPPHIVVGQQCTERYSLSDVRADFFALTNRNNSITNSRAINKVREYATYPPTASTPVQSRPVRLTKKRQGLFGLRTCMIAMRTHRQSRVVSHESGRVKESCCLVFAPSSASSERV